MAETKIEPPILGPSSTTLKVLDEATFTDPKELLKPNGQKTRTRLVREGAGIVGLEDRVENQEWAGIFNHIMLTARIATFLANKFNETGIKVDTNAIINTALLSHSGRRQSDEARWYPDAATEAQQETNAGERETTLKIVRDGKIPDKIVDLVDSHYVGEFGYAMDKLDTLEKKICVYACHRNSQKIISLKERFQDLSRRGVAGKRFSQKHLDAIEEMEKSVEEELFSYLKIRPEDINDEIPQTRWEKYIRRLYINDAEQGIFARLSQLHRDITEGKTGSREELEKEFPENTWWGKYARELYDKRDGMPLHPRAHKQVGIARAIKFYSQLEQTREDSILSDKNGDVK